MKGKLEIPAEIKAIDGKAINLSHPIEISPVSGLSGPGFRLTFWMQGCSLRCTPSCLNAQNLEMKFVEVVSVSRMLDFVRQKMATDKKIEGVSFCGGEPFDQALSLAKVAWGVKEMGLSVVTYTGYLYEELLDDGEPADLALLSQTDILIDGPYLESETSTGLLWRGSKNQRILCLNKDYTRAARNRDWLPHQGTELNWSVDDKVLLHGFQQTEVAEDLIKALKLRGINLQKV